MYDLIYDESTEVVEVGQELVECYLVYHTNGAIRNGFDCNVGRAVEDGTCLALDGTFLEST